MEPLVPPAGHPPKQLIIQSSTCSIFAAVFASPRPQGDILMGPLRNLSNAVCNSGFIAVCSVLFIFILTRHPAPAAYPPRAYLPVLAVVPLRVLVPIRSTAFYFGWHAARKTCKDTATCAETESSVGAATAETQPSQYLAVVVRFLKLHPCCIC
ncbi:hypothetical protein BT67DRAFT_443512, partial [Trichocladium antarcticum]